MAPFDLLNHISQRLSIQFELIVTSISSTPGRSLPQSAKNTLNLIPMHLYRMGLWKGTCVCYPLTCQSRSTAPAVYRLCTIHTWVLCFYSGYKYTQKHSKCQSVMVHTHHKATSQFYTIRGIVVILPWTCVMNHTAVFHMLVRSWQGWHVVCTDLFNSPLWWAVVLCLYLFWCREKLVSMECFIVRSRGT